jgi:tetratricopeptide (TPR) repeat protein
MVLGEHAMEDESLQLFFSYSHHDEALREELGKHLSPFTGDDGIIAGWHDRKLLPGDEWGHQIHDHLETADIILLLISADFVSSRYCKDMEVRTALERHAAGAARVIPILLRAVDWAEAPFSKLQALPKNGKPITSWADRDEAFVEVAQGIREVAENLRVRRQQQREAKQSARDQYQKKVEEIFSASPGHISSIAYDTLYELRETLRLSLAEAREIETSAFEPYKRYEDNLEKYKQTVLKIIKQYPFNEETRKELQYRQRDLGIKPEDVERIEQSLFTGAAVISQTERHVDQIEAQCQSESAEAKQQEHQPHHAPAAHEHTRYRETQPGLATRLRAPSKTRLGVGGSVVVACAFVLMYALLAQRLQPAPSGVTPPASSASSAPLTSEMTAVDFYRRGKAKFHAKDAQGALADYTQALTLRPDYALAYTDRGRVRYELQDYQGALTDYTQALTLEPQDALAYRLRGLVRATLKDAQGALADYTQALTLEPQDALAYNDRGYARTKLKDAQGALTDYTQAITLRPHYALAYKNRGRVYYELQDHEAALADYRKAAELYQQQGKMADYHEVLDRIKELH